MIFHIVAKTDWQQALREGSYAPASLQTEGFVHCSTRDQTVPTANRFFRGPQGLVLLCIDPQHLTPELRYEPPADPDDDRAGELFPHIYGPVNLDAVAAVLDLPCENGSFRLPAAL